MQDILVVDDDLGMRTALDEALRRKGYRVSVAASGPEALSLFNRTRHRLVISDMKMPGMDGVEVLRGIKKMEPATPVLLITAFGTVSKAVEAVKEGALDFIQKPFSLEHLEHLVERALAAAQSGTPEAGGKGFVMTTKSPLMRRTLDFARIAASSDATVLISGESGTGKELVSRFVHSASPRRSGPFVAVNCASIPDGLLESELFGFEKGAFTGAGAARAGKFEQAQGGTLLLDEVSEMDIRLQAKLLRVIQEREVERLGSRTPRALDIRIIATTNRDLQKEVAEGRFREDLFYRLNIFPLVVPPLRKRTEDIPALAAHFMRRFSERYGRRLQSISGEAMEYLRSCRWAGNVRELENTIERSVLLASGAVLEKEHILLTAAQGLCMEGTDGVLRGGAGRGAGGAAGETPGGGARGYGEAGGRRETAEETAGETGRKAGRGAERGAESGTLSAGRYESTGADGSASISSHGARGAAFNVSTIREMERELICRTLEETGGNRTRAARMLGISIRTLRNKLKEYSGQAGRKTGPAA